MKNIIITIALLILGSQVMAYEGDGIHSFTADYPKQNYDSLYELATPLDNSEEGRLALDNLFKAYKGIDHLKKLTSHKTIYGNAEFSVERYFQNDRKFKFVSIDADVVKTRILNNDKGWFVGNAKVQEQNSANFTAELYSYMAQTMPLGIKTEGFSDLRYGKRTDDPLHYIYMKKADTLMVVLGIDPVTNFISKSEGVVYYNDNLSYVVYINLYFNHSEHEGYIFPDSLVNVSMGLFVGHAGLKEVQINPTFDEGCFEPKIESKLE